MRLDANSMRFAGHYVDRKGKTTYHSKTFGTAYGRQFDARQALLEVHKFVWKHYLSEMKEEQDRNKTKHKKLSTLPEMPVPSEDVLSTIEQEVQHLGPPKNYRATKA